ncbi:bifunctional 2-polyprenyl-6-hydroxyphenol methylase/3-demethylubiquinol 3-O-methyltransferase UbiG [Streptomyces sp. MK37H]|uniref:class I SAM-dependent methyltransferase n=1 Tax=Streptomyces sp. MK37H TaxID=2699117 RepID=UPI001B390FD2|nr:class I SAM-dependent methyltransferase [Streptomyces sp. MK37H]MBP8536624.1 methyltransferase domain-containing protein [Streptomyces sp. MK37H]
MTVKNGRRWNHNIHYHPRILHAVPDGAQRALDVGCGEGMLARELRRTVPHVTGIDLDAAGIDQGRAYKDDVDYVLGDFLSHPFEPASFDVLASVAALHHMDAATGLARMRDLLRPGGVLAVVGLARNSMPRDLPRILAAIAVGTVHRARKGHWHHPSPVVWPPPVTYPEMRALTAELLPGSRYRRHVLWRYSIVWRKPRD